MSRFFLILILLSGCASTTNKTLSQNDKSSLGNVGVVSTLGDSLLCTYIGITVFTNEKKTFEIQSGFNENLTSELTTQLSKLGYNTTPVARDSMSFIKDKKRASKFSNIKFNSQEVLETIDTLIILDGSFHYKSTGGYYAKENALNTLANIYAYNVATGELLGKSFKHYSDLQMGFSCEQDSLSPKNRMFKLVKQAGFFSMEKLVNDLFLVSK